MPTEIERISDPIMMEAASLRYGEERFLSGKPFPGVRVGRKRVEFGLHGGNTYFFYKIICTAIP